MRRRTSLNGRWRYAVDEYDQVSAGHMGFVRAEPERKHVDTMWPMDMRTMRLPCSWNMAVPELFHYHGQIVFEKTFERRRPPAHRRLWLCFEASYYRTEVYLNGRFVGAHDGGFTPFSFDVTDHLKGRNVLHVLVDSSRRDERVPCRLTDWFNYGGISRSVFLEERERNAIGDYFIRYTRGRIVGDIETEGRHTGTVRVEIPALHLDLKVPIKAHRGRFSVPAKPTLWSPEHPRLYPVVLSLGQDVVKDRIGFRTIEARDGRILLNGEPIRLKGISLHEEAEPRGRALTPADRRRIFDIAEELGLNFLRLAHYPHAREMALEADRRGILLWEEIPVYWYIQFWNRDTFKDAANQLTELIKRDRNRASVAMWSVANETPEYYKNRTEFIRKLARLAKRLDGTRPVTAALFQRKHEDGTITVDDPLADALDLIGINQYGGWYAGTYDDLSRLRNPKYPDKPIIISEFGAGAKYGFRGRKKFTEDYQATVYRHTLKAIRNNPCIHGVTPWILFDFRSPNRMNIHQNGFNRKGLLDADRTSRKLAFEVYRNWSFK